jgi:hypothetical protein
LERWIELIIQEMLDGMKSSHKVKKRKGGEEKERV